MKREEIKVVYSLTKPFSKLYAGVYIQEPNGLVDSRGIAWRDITEKVGVREDTVPVVASCIMKIFKHFPELKRITYYRLWKRDPIEISRTESKEEIEEKIKEIR